AVARRNLRPQDVEIRRELDAAGGVDRRLVEIHHHAVARRVRIDREVDRADDLLVSGGADVRALRDLDARHFGARGAAEDQREGDRQAQRLFHCVPKLPTKWLNAASHFATVFSGPVSLMKYRPCGVSTTPARIRKCALS